MIILLFVILLPIFVYASGALLTWRHLGYWAIHHNVCLCGTCYNDKNALCAHPGKNCQYHQPCLLTMISSCAWSFIISVLFWFPTVLWWFANKFYQNHSKFKIGFFSPSPLIESREDKLKRKETDMRQREARITKMEIECGIVNTPPVLTGIRL